MSGSCLDRMFNEWVVFGPGINKWIVFGSDATGWIMFWPDVDEWIMFGEFHAPCAWEIKAYIIWVIAWWKWSFVVLLQGKIVWDYRLYGLSCMSWHYQLHDISYMSIQVLPFYIHSCVVYECQEYGRTAPCMLLNDNQAFLKPNE